MTSSIWFIFRLGNPKLNLHGCDDCILGTFTLVGKTSVVPNWIALEGCLDPLLLKSGQKERIICGYLWVMWVYIKWGFSLAMLVYERVGVRSGLLTRDFEEECRKFLSRCWMFLKRVERKRFSTPRKLTCHLKKTISRENTSSNHCFSGDMLVFNSSTCNGLLYVYCNPHISG